MITWYRVAELVFPAYFLIGWKSGWDVGPVRTIRKHDGWWLVLLLSSWNTDSICSRNLHEKGGLIFGFEEFNCVAHTAEDSGVINKYIHVYNVYLGQWIVYESYITLYYPNTCSSKAPLIRRLSSCWLNQPIWKICSSNWIISPNRDKNKTYIWSHHLAIC